MQENFVNGTAIVESAPSQTLSIQSVFRDTFAVVFGNLPLFILIGLSGQSVSIIQSLWLLTTDSVPPVWTIFPLLLLTLALSTWCQIALFIAVQRRLNGQAFTFGQSLTAVRGHFWRYALWSTLCLTVIGAGLFFFVAPGIILGTLFTLTQVIVVLSDDRTVNPLDQSRKLIQPYFWRILWILLVISMFMFLTVPLMIIFSLAQNYIASILLWITYPIFIAFMTAFDVVLYRDLTLLEKAGKSSKQRRFTFWKGCATCLTLLAIVAVLGAVAVFSVMGIYKYLKTDKGAVTGEALLRTISPQIDLGDKLSMRRPEGFLVMRAKDQACTHTLIRFGGEHAIRSITIKSFPKEEFWPTGFPTTFNDPALQRKLVAAIGRIPYGPGDTVNIELFDNGDMSSSGQQWWSFTYIDTLSGTGSAPPLANMCFCTSRHDRIVVIICLVHPRYHDTELLNADLRTVFTMLESCTP